MIKKYILSILICSFSLYAAENGQIQEPSEALNDFFKDGNAVLELQEGTKKIIGGTEFSIDEIETQKIQSADKHSDDTIYRVSISKKESSINSDNYLKRTNKYVGYIACFQRKIQRDAWTIAGVECNSLVEKGFRLSNLPKELSRKFLGYPRHGDLSKYLWEDKEAVRVIKKSGSFYDYRYKKETGVSNGWVNFFEGSYYQQHTCIAGLLVNKYRVIPCKTKVFAEEKRDRTLVSGRSITVEKEFDLDQAYDTYRPTKVGWATIATVVATAGVYGYSWMRRA